MDKTRKPKEDHEEESMKKNIQKRFENMFTGSGEPLTNLSIHEVENLKSRVAELEAQIAQQPLQSNRGSLSPLAEALTKVEPSRERPVHGKKPATTEAKPKQVALWIAGIFIAVSLGFLAYSLYNLFVTQGGRADLSDKALIPLTLVMVIMSVIGFRLMQREQRELGGWILYVINSILPPVLATLFLAQLSLVLTGYLVVFSLVFINFVISRESRLRAIITAVAGMLVIFAIELWDPAFRLPSNHLNTVTPAFGALALLATFAFILRQAMAGNIRTKLIGMFVVVVILAMTVVAFFADRSLRNNLTVDIVQRQASLANSQGFQVGQAIISQFDKLKGLATVKTLQVEAETASLEGTHPLDTVEIEQLNLDWRNTVAAENMADPLVIQLLYNPLSTQLRNFQKTFPENVEILLTDQKGFSIAATDLPSNYYQADTLWWRTAHTTGRYIGQPIFNPATNSIALDIAVPVFSYRNGEFMGVLRATVDFNVLTDLLAEGFRGQTGYSMIYQPNDQQIKLETVGEGNYKIVQDFVSTELQQFVTSPDKSTEVSLNGTPFLVSSAPVRSYSSLLQTEGTTALDDLDWQVIVLQEKSEALQSLSIQTRNNLLLTLLITIVVIILAYFLARFITNPIIQLNAVAMQIAAGDLSAEAKIVSNDEVGTLAANFNTMTSQLRSLFGSLEQRVQDRTHDLELATEVGRMITEKVADASEMLTAAAEMIRSRFDLYYTQVYLTDSAGQKLILRAGTGAVGEQLLSRGHQLLVDSSSLNGQAVLGKKPIIVADTLQSASFKPNPLLPKTRSEMAVPLIANGQVIGVLDMQSERPDALTETNLAAFQALAGQLAIAIQNANLFAETQEARSEVEEQMRRFTEQGWQDLLNAIDRGQKLGFAFEKNTVSRLQPEELEQPSNEGKINIPINVTGTKVGEIQLPLQSNRAWTPSEIELIQATSAQLAQHVENLRLLAQAERFQKEAEQAVRRLTREGWEHYKESVAKDSPGYMFDLIDVKPLSTSSNGHVSEAFRQPLFVRDETIAELTVDGIDPENEASEIITAVAEQLSGHLESLRLLEQTQQRSLELEEAQTFLDSVIESLPHMLFVKDAENLRFLRWNKAAEELTGFPQEEMLGKNDYDFFPKDEADFFTAKDRQVLTSGQMLDIPEEPLATAHQGTRYLHTRKTPVSGADGKPKYLLGVAEDITERKEAEEVLRVSQARLSEALNIAKLANWEYNLEKGKFIFNDHLYSVFHTTAEAVGGYELSAEEYSTLFVHPEDAALVGQEIAKGLASTEQHFSAQLEHRILYADGGLGYMSVAVHIERDENGNIVRWYGANQDITERKKAEIVIQESEARLSEALNIAKLGNWEYDVERDRFHFNDHFYSIFHTTAEQVGGYELSSEDYARLFVYPDDMPIVGEEIGKALASTDRHYSVKLEHRIQFADGGMGYIAVDIHIERDENGKIIRYHGANQDITERKRAEEAVKAEQQRTQTILESVTIPMVITRLSDNHLTFVNAPALAVTQFNFDQVINQPSPNFYANLEDRKKFITDLRAKGEVADMVVQLLRANGETFWALLSAKIFDYQAETSILTTFMDITDRIRAQEIVAKRATELATVAQVSTTASTLLDPDRLLQSVVDLTKERFGLYHAHIYLADEAWQTLLLAAGAGEVGQMMVADNWSIPLEHPSSIVAAAARNKQSLIANDVYRDKDSGFLSNRLLPDTRSEMAVPMIVGEKVLGVFDVQSDAADYFSEEDANIYTTLAAQVAIALQNARLYAEQAATVSQLRELDKLKSSFLANMSHELRTPLNSILGFTDVMMEGLDGPLTEYMDNDLRLIQKNGQHLLHLINDVLDMAKIEAGRMNLNPESFKAFEVLEEVTNITSTLASEKNLSLFIDEVADRDITIYADRTRLRQVMINLVNNSIKFTEKGEVTLNVSPMDGGRVLISVRDTGLGIPPEKLEAIFQEFTQVDSSTTRKTGGTGLGLPISRRLVEMHGGRLWADSAGIPGEGSIFFVELPLEARITEVVERQEK